MWVRSKERSIEVILIGTTIFSSPRKVDSKICGNFMWFKGVDFSNFGARGPAALGGLVSF